MAPDRYRLLRTLGSGGMAQVYEAVAIGASGFERRVAVKRILPQLASDRAMRRMFLDEARIASGLHHGNVVAVLDFGIVDGSELLVMEHVDGLDLRAATRKSLASGIAIEPGIALHVGAEIAHALAYLASAGVVHRDVSPQNVLVSWAGDVKLGDFGIAVAGARAERTATGIVKGKDAYMSPEQARGDEVGPRADVYGLGATLHALLTGEPPSRDAGALRDAALDPEIESLVTSMLADDPAARPDAATVASAAGRLAARSLGRDGRSVLSEWLMKLRARETPPIRSKLDDVMGLCLVSVAGASPERRFTVSREDEIAARDPEQPAAAEREAPTIVPAPARPKNGSIFWWVSCAVGALVAIAVVLGGSLWWLEHRSVASISTSGTQSMERPPVPVAPSPVAADPNEPTGFIRVGGLAIRGADVSIDGRVMGVAPLVARVAYGAHHVVVIDHATRVPLIEGRYVVGPEHTIARPLFVSFRNARPR